METETGPIWKRPRCVQGISRSTASASASSRLTKAAGEVPGIVVLSETSRIPLLQSAPLADSYFLLYLAAHGRPQGEPAHVDVDAPSHEPEPEGRDRK